MKELKAFLSTAAIDLEGVDLIRARFRKGEEARSLANAARDALAGAPQADGAEADALVRAWLIQQLRGQTISETVLRAVWSAASSAVHKPAGAKLVEVQPGKELDALWARAQASAEEKKKRLQAGRKAKKQG